LTGSCVRARELGSMPMALLSAAKTRLFYHEDHPAIHQSGLHHAAPQREAGGANAAP
jgi:hypothetical protein